VPQTGLPLTTSLTCSLFEASFCLDGRSFHIGLPVLSTFPKIILVFTLVDWELFMRRKALFALAEAARDYDSTVVAVNRPLCPWTTVVRKRDRLPELFGAARLSELSDGFYLYSPRYFLHDSLAQNTGLFEKFNITALRRGYLEMCRRIGVSECNPIVWFYHPVQGYVTKMFPGSVNVLEIKDNLADVHGNILESYERRLDSLTPYVNLLLTTSRKLFEKYSPGFKHAWKSGNGLDRETYRTLVQGNLQRNPEIEKIPKPRIGYTGLVSKRLDWPLIKAIAKSKPDWNLVFIGSIFDKSIANDLDGVRNIHFTGGFDHAEIPSILGSLDVGFMPYLDNEFFSYSNPLKFYEFAAAGLPAVSSSMEELRDYPNEIVSIVPNSSDEWVAAIQRFLDSDRDRARSVGTDFAKRFLWEDMAAGLLDRIHRQFYSRGQNAPDST
jgi:hypothetical protein